MGQEDNKLMPPGHLERYHPHGIKEGDKCKYINGSVGKTHSVGVEKAKNSYLAFSIPNGIDNAEKRLWEDVGVRCIYTPTKESLRYVFGGDILTAEVLCLLGKPITREQYEYNLKVFFEVCGSLKNTNSSFNLGKTLFLGWDLYDTKKWYASSTLDKRLHVRTRYITLGDIKKAREQYERSFDAVHHIIRHEIGHNLATEEVVSEFKRVIPKEDSKGWQIFKDAVLKFPNKEARHDGEETIAETFAVVTDPLYKKGTLPE